MLKKIRKIKWYKSFIDYNIEGLNWLCEKDFWKLSFIFAENGCGKSSLCNILKSLYNYQDFNQDIPEHVSLETSEWQFEFNSDGWTHNDFSKEDILFFDTDFINQNVHKWKTRGSTFGEQEQNSGKLLVDFDSEAIRKEKQYDFFKEKYWRISSFETSQERKYQTDLISPFENFDNSIFSFYRQHSNDDLESIKQERLDFIKENNEKINVYDKNISNTKEIQDIERIEKIPSRVMYTPSKKEDIEKLFDFSVPDNILESWNQEELIKHIKSHQNFFKEGKKVIHEWDTHTCPFCQAYYTDERISNILDILHEIVWGERERLEKNFVSKIKTLTDNFSEIVRYKQLLQDKVSSIDTYLNSLKEKIDIPGIDTFDSGYLYQRLSNFRDKDITEFKNSLVQLTDCKFSHSYDDEKFLKYIAQLSILYDVHNSLNKIIIEKNFIIREYKNKFGDKSVVEKEKERIEFLNSLADKELGYLDFENLKKQEKKNTLEKYFEWLWRVTQTIKNYRDKYKKLHRDYCATEIFERTIESMGSYMSYFRLDLSLENITSNRNTVEYPFAYKLVDWQGRARTFEEGLSEWERQILSLSFFFAWVDTHNNIDNKILIFDDPITSMDSWNLHKLSRLIIEKRTYFKQVIVLTHHPLFFKYLRKGAGADWVWGCQRFWILKNKKQLWGSFIYYQKPSSNTEELRRIISDDMIFLEGSTEYERNVIKFGQMLRYEVENFIKNRILQWQSDDSFDILTKNLKNVIEAQNSWNLDIPAINEIYKYCNWSNTNHTWEDMTSWIELKDKIESFLQIYDNFEA